jgi:hypothetical protein
VCELREAQIASRWQAQLAHAGADDDDDDGRGDDSCRMLLRNTSQVPLAISGLGKTSLSVFDAGVLNVGNGFLSCRSPNVALNEIDWHTCCSHTS